MVVNSAFAKKITIAARNATETPNQLAKALVRLTMRSFGPDML